MGRAGRVGIVGVLWLVAMSVGEPASAQVNLVGDWTPRYHQDYPDRIPGPELGDYTGLPLTDGARLTADSWDAARLSLREHQCKVHIAPYTYHGPMMFRVSEVRDPNTQQLVAIKNYINTYEQERTIWMDGREHPPAWAPHTWMGFSTGKWQGNILVVYTTHLKQEWIRRNGVSNSDQSTTIEHFIRHGNILTHFIQWTDPVYLTEPYYRSEDFVLAERPGGSWTWPCEYVEEVDRPSTDVPHFLPGKSAFQGNFAWRFDVPVVAARGGAETTYPEYVTKLRSLPKPAKPVPGEPLPPMLPQQPQTRPAPAWESSGDIRSFHVQGNVYLLVGAGANIAVQTGDEGVLVVDTGLPQHAEKVLAAIRKLSDKPIRYIINTQFGPEHVGGNDLIAKAGRTTEGGATTIIANENVLTRMSASVGGQPPPYPTTAWPTSAFFTEEKDLFFNGEPVVLYHVKNGHTDSDILVFFRGSNVVVSGDDFTTSAYPVIDLARGGGVQGVLDGLNRLLDIAVPAHLEEGGTYIVPGHGRVCDEADVLEYRDMMTIVRDRIVDMVSRGMTLQQVQAAMPSLDYDAHYGASTGPWTTAMFVEAIYKSVSKPAATAAARP